LSYWSYAGGLVLQLYSTEAGFKLAELTKNYLPRYWLNDNQILLFDYGVRLEAVGVPAGRKLYESKLVYKSSQITKTHTRPSGSFPGLTDGHTEYMGWVVHDETKIVPHVSGRMFLTYSNQYVKVYDAQTEAVLQTLVEPAVDTSKPVDPQKGPRLSDEPLVSKADWSSDGNTLYIVSADRKSVSFWSMN
jgi:WD40 repeat protein